MVSLESKTPRIGGLRFILIDKIVVDICYLEQGIHLLCDLLSQCLKPFPDLDNYCSPDTENFICI